MAIDFGKYNDAVKTWGAGTKMLMQTTARNMGIQHRENSRSKGASIAKIRERFGYDSTGFINRITFGTINRSLIFAAAGAGKGMGGLKGSRWIDKYGNRKITNPTSLGKAGTGSRNENPFIEKSLASAEGIEKLADIVATYQADAIVDNIYKK